MKIIGVIPARYESSRFPGKPLTEILGKPMIWWVYKAAIKVEEFHDVLVATDDYRIHDYCSINNINCIMTNDCPTGSDRVANVSDHTDGDLYINIQGDEPLLKSSYIKTLIKEAVKNLDHYQVFNAMSKCSSTDMENIGVPKVVTNNSGMLLFASRLPIPYSKTGYKTQYYKELGLHGYTKKGLDIFRHADRGPIELSEDIEFLRFVEHGIDVKMIVLKLHSMMHAVDYPEDIEIVEDEITSRYDAIVFDFDGVLIDSEKLKADAFKKLFPPFIHGKIDIHKGGKSRYEKIRFLYNEFLGIRLTKAQNERIANEYSKLIFQKIVDMVPNRDIVHNILKLRNIDFYIVSGTPTKELIDIMAQMGLIGFFKGIYGADEEKHKTLQKISKNYSKGKMIYIGDNITDKTASEKAGVKFFGYGPRFGNKDIQEIWIE